MKRFEEIMIRYKEEGLAYLRANVPEIQRIESFSGLHNLRVKKQADLDDILFLHYDAKAPELFHAVRQRLIDAGVAKRHNVIRMWIENKGMPDELYRVDLRFYGSSLLVHLDVHR
jgi:hypothetical protein